MALLFFFLMFFSSAHLRLFHGTNAWVTKDAFISSSALLRLNVTFGSPCAAAFITTVMSYLCSAVACRVQYDVMKGNRGMHFVSR